MLTQQQNDQIGEESVLYFDDMELEMLTETGTRLAALIPEDDGAISASLIYGAVAGLTVAHNAILTRYMKGAGRVVYKDAFAPLVLNASTEVEDSFMRAAMMRDAEKQAAAAAADLTGSIVSQSQFIATQANRAYLSEALRAAGQVVNGTNAKQAVAGAVSRLARQGVTFSTYIRQGRVVHVPVDVGVRRMIRTEMCERLVTQTLGIASATGANLVEVDYSTNPRESHADWEGQVYQLDGAGEFNNFYIACRWGDPVDGIGGYNCQHNVCIYRGVRMYRDPLEGTGYTKEQARELTSRQRYLENAMRKDKRERDVLKAAGLPTKEARAKLAAHQRAYEQLTSSHSILTDQSWRTRIYAQASEAQAQAIIAAATR